MIATALEPIYLDVDYSYEEYELIVDDGDEYDVELDTVIKVVTITGDMYGGPYVVDPEFEEQILATRNKTMSDDVTVHRIDVSTVENPAGGNTVYIGGII